MSLLVIAFAKSDGDTDPLMAAAAYRNLSGKVAFTEPWETKDGRVPWKSIMDITVEDEAVDEFITHHGERWAQCETLGKDGKVRYEYDCDVHDTSKWITSEFSVELSIDLNLDMQGLPGPSEGAHPAVIAAQKLATHFHSSNGLRDLPAEAR